NGDFSSRPFLIVNISSILLCFSMRIFSAVIKILVIHTSPLSYSRSENSKPRTVPAAGVLLSDAIPFTFAHRNPRKEPARVEGIQHFSVSF
ncbi:hypothetical protein, partial [Escherichia coli]|uniref:hypothetical protein n=1 Tax=Escherichia coli TaxID=562 RepID=UPI0030C73E82